MQIDALLATLEFKESAGRKGHFALHNCLVIGHTKYNGMQRVYCNPFPKKPFYGRHLLDLVMIQPPGIDHGGFVVSRLHLTPFGMLGFCSYFFENSFSAHTNTGSKTFDCALVSTLETYDILRRVIIAFMAIICIMDIIYFKRDLS